MSTFSVSGLVGRYATRLGTGSLLVVTLALLIISVVIPDPLPFIDEILLAMAALWLARRKRRTTVPDEVEPAGEPEGAPVTGSAKAGGRTIDGAAREAGGSRASN